MKTIGFLFLGILIITASQFGRSFDFEEKKIFISPPPHIEYFSFGHQAAISGIFWVRAIQDFDYCEKPLAKNLCQGKGWLFQILDATTRLAPDFREVYSAGGVSLSVLVSDVEGAAEIFRKGTLAFPKDFQILYRAGYHALIEEKDKAKAAGYFLKAAQIQGTEGTWLYSLATRLYADSGEKEAALEIYQSMKDSGLDEGVLKRMREKLGLPEGS